MKLCAETNSFSEFRVVGITEGGETAIPEFSTVGGIIILIIAGLGIALVIRKKK